MRGKERKGDQGTNLQQMQLLQGQVLDRDLQKLVVFSRSLLHEAWASGAELGRWLRVPVLQQLAAHPTAVSASSCLRRHNYLHGDVDKVVVVDDGHHVFGQLHVQLNHVCTLRQQPGLGAEQMLARDSRERQHS